MYTEGDIREHLAANLDVLEKGLCLLAQEYHLKNPNGASGRIDILARDRFDNLVVIELKKSNATARTAIHELLTYLALLKAEKGIASERLRCLLVSTNWESLRAPFSELVGTSPFTLEGRLLQVDALGKPLSAEPVAPSPISDGFQFPEHFPWLVCSTKDAQSALANRLMELLPAIGLENVVLVLLTSKRPDDLQFPFSVAVPFFPLSAQVAANVLKQSRWPIPMLPDYSDVPPGTEDFAIAVTESVQSKMFCLPEVRDVHHVDRLTFWAERDGWNVDEVRRQGPLVSDAVVLSDQDIVKNLQGGDGSNGGEMVRAVDPAHPRQFTAFKEAIEPLLARYGWWDAARQFLEEAAIHKNSTVLAHVYSPDKILVHIVLYLRTGDPRYLPSFRLMWASEQSSDMMLGRLAWDGQSTPPTADDLVRLVGHPILALAFRPDDLSELDLVSLLGLHSFSARFSEREASSVPPLRVHDWVVHNAAFAARLCQLFRVTVPVLPSDVQDTQ